MFSLGGEEIGWTCAFLTRKKGEIPLSSGLSVTTVAKNTQTATRSYILVRMIDNGPSHGWRHLWLLGCPLSEDDRILLDK
jgi:hypothetical protein